MDETFGPFDVYTEVETPQGVFGLQPGQTLRFEDNVAYHEEQEEAGAEAGVEQPPLRAVVVGEDGVAVEDAEAEEQDEAEAAPAETSGEVTVLGNGWYQVGDERFHGRDALESAGYTVPGDE